MYIVYMSVRVKSSDSYVSVEKIVKKINFFINNSQIKKDFFPFTSFKCTYTNNTIVLVTSNNFFPPDFFDIILDNVVCWLNISYELVQPIHKSSYLNQESDNESPNYLLYI